MRLQILVDMNLSPQWVPALQKHRWPAVHWSTVGDPGAIDKDIMDWARDHRYVVFTHDLDFGTMLALSHEAGPSVLQVRSEDILPDFLEELVVPLSISIKPICLLGPWSWLTRVEAGFECCRYETACRTLPTK